MLIREFLIVVVTTVLGVGTGVFPSRPCRPVGNVGSTVVNPGPDGALLGTPHFPML